MEHDWDKIESMAREYKKQQEFNNWINDLKKNIYIDIKDQES
jgi:hypothetical protein